MVLLRLLGPGAARQLDRELLLARRHGLCVRAGPRQEQRPDLLLEQWRQRRFQGRPGLEVAFGTDLGNTRLAGSFVFGGQYADTPPFVGTTSDPLKPPSGSLKMEIGAGLVVETNHSAQEIFLDTDVVDSLKALSAALGADNVPGVQAAMTRIDNAFQATQVLVGELGGRMNQLDLSVSNLDSLEVTLKTFRSGLADADMAEAITELVNRQGSLEAAMLANSKILNITLTDYLR